LEFLIDTPKPVGEGGGIGNAILGSLMMTILACAIGLPIGIAAGVYLSEMGDGWYGKFVRFIADTLTGIPSIIVGIFIYTLVVLPMGRQSGLAGGLALAIIMIPIVARTTEEMIRLVPNSMREGALALGAPKWRVTWNIVLPAASTGIATGAMLAIARISGETAPLLFTALNSRFYNYFYDQPMASLTVQIFNYATGPFDVEHQLAWAATLVLVGLILMINIGVRYLTRRRY
jgi:phosphate transport system permease protein